MARRIVAARRRAFLFGMGAESRAAWWLRLKGYRILARRYRGGGGEIDLIARRFATIAFVEVKGRAALDDAALSVTPWKMRRVARAARAWLAAHPPPAACVLRLDAVTVAPGHVPRHTVNVAPLED
jgi:putative endonuclease